MTELNRTPLNILTEAELERSHQIGSKFLAWVPITGPCPISINDRHWFKKLCGLFETIALLETQVKQWQDRSVEEARRNLANGKKRVQAEAEVERLQKELSQTQMATQTPPDMQKELHDYAAKATAELRARVAELEAANRWIPVKERLPEEGQKTLVCLTAASLLGAVVDMRIYSGPLNKWGYYFTDITHWRPLPEPPEETA